MFSSNMILISLYVNLISYSYNAPERIIMKYKPNIHKLSYNPTVFLVN